MELQKYPLFNLIKNVVIFIPFFSISDTIKLE